MMNTTTNTTTAAATVAANIATNANTKNASAFTPIQPCPDLGRTNSKSRFFFTKRKKKFILFPSTRID